MTTSCRVKTDSLARLAGQLETHQVAGMVVRRFPDNSVVCHARRLAGLTQDVFVSGAVLGVHCNSLPLSLFPDIYNEDWFFFAKEAARRRLPRVGHAVQEQYEPFADPQRARGGGIRRRSGGRALRLLQQMRQHRVVRQDAAAGDQGLLEPVHRGSSKDY